MKRMNKVLLVCLLMAMGGCATDKHTKNMPVDINLPVWFTAPKGVEQKDTPVDIGIVLPKHLQSLAKVYGLPGWVVYGVVRSLGANEFVANGKIKTFSVSDEDGEDSVVVDSVYYDVPATEVNAVLGDIARKCSEAENELDRKNVLGSYVVKRFGGVILFSLDRAGMLKDNLLLTTGESHDSMEVFNNTKESDLPSVGWRETPTHYITTEPGIFLYGNPVLAFRQTEENAIKDMAKSIMLNLSHMRKSVTEDVDGQTDEIAEDVSCEEITLRMRGVRVIRRAVDVKQGLCLVEISVPRSGVSLK